MTWGLLFAVAAVKGTPDVKWTRCLGAVEENWEYLNTLVKTKTFSFSFRFSRLHIEQGRISEVRTPKPLFGSNSNASAAHLFGTTQKLIPIDLNRYRQSVINKTEKPTGSLITSSRS